MRKFGKAILIGALALGLGTPFANFTASAQGEGSSSPLVSGDRLYCGGYITDNELPKDVTRIVGSLKEVEAYFLYNGQRAYINKGKNEGIQVGDTFQAVRGSGAFYHPFKDVKLKLPQFQRRGKPLGFFVEELGFVRVIAVQEKTATIEITEACTEIRLGDALVKFEKPSLPQPRGYTPLDPFAPPSGKTAGQIILARGSREQLATSDIVAIDLGQNDGVKVGDYMTIFRAQGSDGINNILDDEVAARNSEGGSERFRGNSRSIIRANIPKEKIRKDYPSKDLPRTVIGEVVITRVEGKTATAVITRVQFGEIVVGDQVELQ